MTNNEKETPEIGKKLDLAMSADDKELDLTDAGRGLWLVKVPKYIAQKWENAPSNMDVGTMRIKREDDNKMEVSLSIPQEVVDLKPKLKIPSKYDVRCSVEAGKTLGIVSNEGEEWRMEGCITQTFECTPVPDETYKKMVKKSIRKARKTQPQKKIENVEKCLIPVNDQANNVECSKRKKGKDKKFRAEKDAVLEMIFRAFERHQYYHIRDLLQITNQPVAYLKKLLEEVCDYNPQNPHRGTWELKKQYRHYKTDKKEEVKTPENKSDSE